MHRFLTATLIFIFTAFTQANISVEQEDKNHANFIGYAYDLKTEELLYTEHHKYLDKITHEVQYKEINGDLFARKLVDYQYSFYAPDILQTNNRNGELIEIQRTSKESKKISIRYQESENIKLKQDSVNYTSDLIIDAGFNQYITRNWNVLVESENGNGKTLTIDYLIPSALDHYKLSIQKEDCDNNKNYCFSISASSFFISLFSSDLKLTYSKVDNKLPRLISFQGRSNICDSEGNYQDVTIMYEYEN